MAVTYQQKDGTKFTVSKEYTIYYDEEKLLIQTNLSDQTVKSDHISFRAWAQLGKETFCTDGNAKRYRSVPMKTGIIKTFLCRRAKNQIVLDAEKRRKERTAGLYHNLMNDRRTRISRFDTDLEDKEVYKKKYRFLCTGFLWAVTKSKI